MAESNAVGVITNAKEKSSSVAEIFLTASTAFNRLAELTLQLKEAAAAEELPDEEEGASVSDRKAMPKWSEKELGMLTSSIDRFVNDLNKISSKMKTKSIDIVRKDLKRKVDSSTAPTPVVAKKKPGPKKGWKANSIVQSHKKTTPPSAPGKAKTKTTVASGSSHKAKVIATTLKRGPKPKVAATPVARASTSRVEEDVEMYGGVAGLLDDNGFEEDYYEDYDYY